jgi:putative flippase GtrA
MSDFVAHFGTGSRFLIGGAINTAGTYVVYLGLRTVVDYQWAFLAAYLLGIAFSYVFNALVVFRTQLRWASAVSFPFVYVLQYGASAGILALLVEGFGLDERIAPLIVTVAMIPLTYYLTRFIFKTTSRRD